MRQIRTIPGPVSVSRFQIKRRRGKNKAKTKQNKNNNQRRREKRRGKKSTRARHKWEQGNIRGGHQKDQTPAKGRLRQTAMQRGRAGGTRCMYARKKKVNDFGEFTLHSNTRTHTQTDTDKIWEEKSLYRNTRVAEAQSQK